MKVRRGEYDNKEEEEKKANEKRDNNKKELDTTGTEEEEHRKSKAKKTKPQVKGKKIQAKVRRSGWWSTSLTSAP